MAANMNYTIRVRAGNQYGLGEPSPPSISFTTLPMPPTKTVRNVTGGGGKHGTLVVHWEPMSPTDYNGAGFLYRVFWRAKGAVEDDKLNVAQPKQLDGGKRLETTITLGENQYFKPFEVRVQAVNQEVSLKGITESVGQDAGVCGAKC
ncbi:unnamed protein product [Protopolystoma xenopodis]|uniref:Fibronectin type-III domain-containing protein n=1 Tax=Protopolystoma xenopodis TaxID=117903 RepID=A0A3S5CGQ9_9PLAT|nr:unnamed protein product [Protopolystoma xenopodis]